ncbi:MAG TPA: thioredoxin family protein [Puia sp.]|nr:thioredoxin family protein [Puia sp.]
MGTLRPARTIGSGYLEKAMSYTAYKKLIEDLLVEGKSTGPHQSEAFNHYSQLNLQRMHRLEKTMQLLPDLKERVQQVGKAQIWLVLTEGWCGDAAQSIPVMNAFAQENSLIRLQFILRDENLDLMDQYLTNGIARSIPKLIALDAVSHEELFNWGPRPAPLQELFYRMKGGGMAFDAIKEELQRWYNKDKTITIQQELGELVWGAGDAGMEPRADGAESDALP